METKICNTCDTSKALSEYYRNLECRLNVSNRCKDCEKEKRKAHRKTHDGLIYTIYFNQRRNCKERKHEMPTYSLDWLKEWVKSQSNFKELFNNWVNSDYDKYLVPSVDRLDDYKSYSPTNIRLVTFRDNLDKISSDKINGINNKQNVAVVQYTKKGQFVNEFHSVSEAIRQTGAYVSECCLGKRKTSKGFKFKYKSVSL